MQKNNIKIVKFIFYFKFTISKSQTDDKTRFL